jgi:hypothetical protein
MSTEPVLDPDAAIVLGFASTAMPFARTPADEAERWLRILRIHGDVGHLLQALGVSDASVETAGSDGDGEASIEASAGERGPNSESHGGESPAEAQPASQERDAVAQVAEEARHVASRRGCASVATTDVLTAVMHVYGEDFDRVLRAHGTDRAAVLKLLGAARATS